MTGIVERLRAAGCVYAEEEAQLLVDAARGPDELASMVERRTRGEPLEHIVGWAEFCGLRIAVEPGVFVPRRRTEFLAEQAAGLVRTMPGGAGGPVLVDLCCGSAAIGVALATRIGNAELHVADVDAAAVRCARRNVERVGGQVYQGDLFDPLPDRLHGRVALLIANTPYVPTSDIALMPTEARVHEPRVALDGGPDGLDVQRRVAAAAPRWLAPGGHLLVEVGQDQAGQAVEILTRSGLRARSVGSDDVGATVVIGTSPPA